MEEVKLTYTVSLQPERIPKVWDRLAPRDHGTLLQKWHGHFMLVEVAPDDLCSGQDFRSSTENVQQCFPRNTSWAWEAVAPSECAALGDCSSLAHWLESPVCSKLRSWEGERIHCQSPQILLPSEKNKFLLNHMSFHSLQEIQLHFSITRPHCTGDLSLIEASLYAAWQWFISHLRRSRSTWPAWLNG